jgi:hypothetical protein
MCPPSGWQILYHIWTAKKLSTSGTNPPQIAPWWKQKALAVARTASGQTNPLGPPATPSGAGLTRRSEHSYAMQRPPGPDAPLQSGSLLCTAAGTSSHLTLRWRKPDSNHGPAEDPRRRRDIRSRRAAFSVAARRADASPSLETLVVSRGTDGSIRLVPAVSQTNSEGCGVG